MKHLVYLTIILAMLTGCRKDHGYQNSGTIIGADYRKCMCCGGWFIKIGNDTLRFQNLPEGSNINLTDVKYPIDVYLDWNYPDPQCMPDQITVTRMELKK
jgi:hypothetical protein